jgi:hypothetical protein
VQHLFQNANSQVPPPAIRPLQILIPAGYRAKISTIVKHGCPRSRKSGRIDIETTKWRRLFHMVIRVVASCLTNLVPNRVPIQFRNRTSAKGPYQPGRCHGHPPCTPALIIPRLPHCKPPHGIEAEPEMQRSDPKRNIGALNSDAGGVTPSRRV